MRAYRCDKCGQWRDGEDYSIIVNTPLEDEAIVIDLCPECAPAVIDPIAAIANKGDE